MDLDRRALIPLVAALVVLAGCDRWKKKSPALSDGGVPIGPPAIVAVQEPDPCPELGPNEVTEQTNPSIAGVGERIEAMPWFTARGVSPATLTALWRSRIGRGIDRELAESDVLGAYCSPLIVGDKHEPAMACSAISHDTMMIERLFVIVVRSKQPVVVLDVGVAAYAMDWPEARYLDLAVAFAPDGMSATYKERAPDGSLLVLPPQLCHEWWQHILACEVDAGLDCPIVSLEDGGRMLVKSIPPPPSPPARLNGCPSAQTGMKDVEKNVISDPEERATAQYVDRFVTRSCSSLGRYEWKGGRFARVTP